MSNLATLKPITHWTCMYTSVELMAWRLSEYIYSSKLSGEPLSINGMYRAVGMARRTWDEYACGDKDHLQGNILDGGRTISAREGDERVKEFNAHYEGRSDLYKLFYYIVKGVMLPDALSSDPEYMREAVDECDRHEHNYSEIIGNARLILNEEVELRLHNGKVGDIMRAKMILGWQNEQVKVNKFELAGSEKTARLEQLGYKKIDE